MDKAASRIRLHSCKANEVQMKNKTAFVPLKTMKNRSTNLYNRFFICNSFLLLVLYLHGDYGK